MTAGGNPSETIRAKRHANWPVIIASSHILWWLTVAACVLVAVGFFSRYSFFAELICHFRVQYLICLGLALLWFVVMRQWGRSVMTGAFLLLNGLTIAPLYWPADARVQAQESWRVVECNVLRSNRSHDLLLNTIRKLEPDIAVFLEVDNEWNQVLTKLADDLPYSVEIPRESNFGITVRSRFELRNVEQLELGNYRLPAILTRVDLGPHEITLIAAHVIPPRSAAILADRNESFRQVADIAGQNPENVLLVGDLNCTPWSAAFGDLKAQSRLRDSTIGYGVQPTWPSRPVILRIPIDHCLVSDSIHIENRFVATDVGSDHLPLVVDFSIMPRANFKSH